MASFQGVKASDKVSHIVVEPSQPHGCNAFSHGVLYFTTNTQSSCLSQPVPEDTIISAIGGDDNPGRPF